MISCQNFTSPLGPLTITIEDYQLIQIKFGKKKSKEGQKCPLYAEVKRQILQYCLGKRQNFSLPYALEGTPFQLKVWRAMSNIPFGKQRSYKDLAREVKSPQAFRAVGGACHRNPLPLIIPCHRVVGSNGHLTGFAGGLKLKKHLLSLENSIKFT